MAIVRVIFVRHPEGDQRTIALLPPIPPSDTVDVRVRKSDGSVVVYEVARAPADRRPAV